MGEYRGDWPLSACRLAEEFDDLKITNDALLINFRAAIAQSTTLRAELAAVKAERLDLADAVDQWSRASQGATDARKAQSAASREGRDNRPVRKAMKNVGHAFKVLAVTAPLARRVIADAEKEGA